MNPSGTQRPVMDVSAPRPSQSPASSTPSDQIAVRPAPLATATTEPPKAIEQQPQVPSAPVAKAKPSIPSEPVKQRSGAPVGVITAAVLVMMVLSAAAVIVYATSQTA